MSRPRWGLDRRGRPVVRRRRDGIDPGGLGGRPKCRAACTPGIRRFIDCDLLEPEAGDCPGEQLGRQCRSVHCRQSDDVQRRLLELGELDAGHHALPRGQRYRIRRRGSARSIAPVHSGILADPPQPLAPGQAYEVMPPPANRPFYCLARFVFSNGEPTVPLDFDVCAAYTSAVEAPAFAGNTYVPYKSAPQTTWPSWRPSTPEEWCRPGHKPVCPPSSAWLV